MGILGVHKIKQKPVVRDGEIVVGDVMLLSLSFDHRIIDGHVGAAFAYDVIGNLLSKSDVGTYTYPRAGSALPQMGLRLGEYFGR